MSPPFLRDGGTGVWGPPSSTMDWCEENYRSSYYLAEFWNSVSNIVFLILPLTVLYYTRRKLELRFHLDFLSLAVVGIGSFAFHSTLIYQSQLLDELPMIYGTCIMLYCVLECEGEENRANVFLVTVLTGVSLFVTMIYIYGKDPMIFLVSYGVLAILLFLIHIYKCIKHQGNKRLLVWGAISYGLGFILWNIDNELCFGVRKTREQLPGILRPMTQLHAWWHVFAGIGTFLSIVFSVHLRYKCLGYEPILAHVRGILPYYERGNRIFYKANNGGVQLDLNGNMNNTSPQLKSRRNGSTGSLSRLL